MSENTWGKYKGEIVGVRFETDSFDKKTNEQYSDDPRLVKAPYFPPAEKEFISALQSIARKYGKLADRDDNGIWVGYVPKAKNDNYSMGIRCENCAHFESENVCKIAKVPIEPGGYCRLSAIPSEKIVKPK